MEYVHHYESPLGDMTMASNGKELTGLWFEEQRYYADGLSDEFENKELPVFDETRSWLDMYFCGKEPDFTPPLCINATAFRRRVCEIMLTISYGQTMTYSQIGEIIAKEKGIQRMSAQAVGGAVGHNSISIIIPCHRVVGTNGSLTGYAGGIDKKIQLLTIENKLYFT